MTLSNLQTKVLVNNKPIKTYYDEEGRCWVEARNGSTYSIQVKNTSNKSVLAVISVDGINVISGEQAEVKEENGYIIRPYSILDIEGWRISNEKVKKFIFTFNKEKSYSVKLGAGKQNLGVIGFAFFKEKPVITYRTSTTFTFPQYSDYMDTGKGIWDSSGDMTISNSTGDIDSATVYSCNVENLSDTVKDCNVRKMKSVDFAAGTGKGKAVNSSVVEVPFESDGLLGTHAIYYDSYKNLKKRGILDKRQEFPHPFKKSRYCPDV